MPLFAPYEPRAATDPRPHLPADLCIRPAGPADVPALARLIADREGDDAATHVDRLREELDVQFGPARQLLIAEVGGGGGGGGGGEDHGGAGGRLLVAFARVIHCAPRGEPPANAAPPGWYLGGVIVAPAHRRRGIARELTRRRLDWLRARGAAEAYFVANAANRASIDLHAPFGFREVTRDFVQAGVTFTGPGERILFRLDLTSAAPPTR